MTCERTPSYNYKERNNYCDKDNFDCILATVKKIDQIQKEALIEEKCEGCTTGLIEKLYNTKPVIFYLCCGEPFCVEIPRTTPAGDARQPEQQCSKYFRIQEVKGECVILRILDPTGSSGKLECTNFTAILNLKCVCGIQCLPPICCEECTRIVC